MPLSLLLPALFVVGWFAVGIGVVVWRDLCADDAQPSLAVAGWSVGKLAGGFIAAHALDLLAALAIVVACVVA